MPSIRAVLHGAQVVLGDPRARQVASVDLRIEGGRITEIAPATATSAAGEEAPFDVIDVSGRWILPGFVDAHQHAWHSVLRSLLADSVADDADKLTGWVAGHLLGPQDLYAATFGGIVSQLDAGVTTGLDHCDAIRAAAFAESSVAAHEDAGARSVWCYGLDSPFDSDPTVDVDGPHWDRHGQVRELHEHMQSRAPGMLALGVAPRSSLPLDEFAAQVRLARDLEAPLLTHTDDRKGHHGLVVSQTWADAGLLSSRQVHAHCSATPPDVLARFADVGCSVVSSPDLELGSGLGYTALRAADDAGVTTALGTGSQARTSPDMFATMRMGLQSERGRYQQEAAEARGTSGLTKIAMRSEEVLHFATLGGARALGLGDVCGSIEVGKAADLIIIDPSSPRLRPLVDPLGGVVMQMTVADIEAVLVAGEFRKRNGRMDEAVLNKAIEGLDHAFHRLDEAASRDAGHGLADFAAGVAATVGRG